MKHLFAVLLACLLLCGCAQTPQPPEPTLPTQSISIPTTGPEGLYDPENSIEEATHGAIRAYPLPVDMASGMHFFGDSILLFSGDTTTTLTLLTGDTLYIAATAELGIPLDPNDPSLRIGEAALSYCDPLSRELVVLDKSLKSVSRIALPEDLTGSPILSSDRNILYYCTKQALKAWDLESGIRRTVKEMAYPEQTVTNLLMEDTIVQCTAEGKSLFLSAKTGQILEEIRGAVQIRTEGSRFYASLPLGFTQAQVFGDKTDAQLLLPTEFRETTFLPSLHAAVTAHSAADGLLELEYYDLHSGFRHSLLTLTSDHRPTGFLGQHGFVYLLIRDDAYGCNTIYRWDIHKTVINDGYDYTSPYSSAISPDQKGLEKCQIYADSIAERYGIQILIGEEAAAVQPWDYDLEAEYLPGILWWELEQLEKHLAQYPEDMLAQTASPFTGLTLCLVRSITGSAESGSLNMATGVQFLEDYHAYVVLAAGQYAEHALYHELFHVMETHIFNESIAFDQWERLNPAGFSYDYNYATNQTRESGIYLNGELRAFVDTYSMSFPKEDRARIMEYAMLPGFDFLFEAPAMQAKLRTLCEGIREAYGLQNRQDPLVWEQYLTEPLFSK